MPNPTRIFITDQWGIATDDDQTTFYLVRAGDDEPFVLGGVGVGEVEIAGVVHPGLSTHDTLGLATDAELAAHAATSHGGVHPDLATHDTLGLATDTELGDALDAHEIAADPHTIYQRESEKGVAFGYASLGAGATIPDAEIPSSITRDSELADLNIYAHGSDDAGSSWTPLLVLSDGTLVVTN